ncbi:fructosamine kinase family protein [Pseudoalteromonas denitrificans]|uniref:Fructosamine-3-kinase n=1 Tax=Pseudoalteromonas denitrificans DSM 6059 TaxID=1123010 RepID=A0A1I1P4R5_9GAMM|nr:fructosamine kinase family protein [Pseudoalteromonas denitrificans]SFD00940.1 Fructosamine-3-kinase [Pseudoalteromonas denitrificans DSM 6059]
MWHAISKHISEELHFDFVIQHKQQLKSHSNHSFFKISDNNHHYFVKLAPYHFKENFECETFNLAELTNKSIFFIPDCICTGSTLAHSYVVLEWLEFQNNSEQNWAEFGITLAKMHNKHEQAMFGWEHDNFIASTLQPNKWHKNWCYFFSEQRIGWQLQLLQEKGFNLCNINDVVSLVKNKLHRHTTVLPSLLHGDLWRGNTGFVKGKPAIFDGACYYGDRETDIAMTELFGPFPDTFYQAYEKTYPLQKGYLLRKKIYQLYHLLNHANLFQGHYLIDAQEHIKSIFDQE